MGFFQDLGFGPRDAYYPDSMKTLNLTLQYEGLCDFDGLYAAIIDWAKNYGFLWHEVDYKHKVPSPLGAEQELKFLMTKRIDPYVVYQINMHIHIYEMLDVEVKVGDKIKNLTKASLYVKFVGTVVLDWQKRFKKGGALGKSLSALYKRIYKHEISGIYWDTLVYRVYNLQHVVKGYFDMQSKKYAFKGYIGEH